MHAIRQKCRPKHQVLILKCYPRTTKGAVDVKPNSSELSYLLYYATTRRSKVQKVGAFLEKKTASDVWRARIGYVDGRIQAWKSVRVDMLTIMALEMFRLRYRYWQLSLKKRPETSLYTPLTS